MKKIVVDIYGADAGEEIIIRGVAEFMQHNDIFPVFVGCQKTVVKIMGEFNIDSAKYEVINTNDYVLNTEPATCVFGGRDNSSMVLALEKLKNDDECCALLSAGNTGALLVGSICRLGLLPSIKFPALCSALPCAGEKLLCLVDCGASIDCTANDLLRFAKMGNIFSKCYVGIDNPRIGLMSVGREDSKGSALTIEAFKKIKETNLNFVGNLEGSDMVSGYADVIVTDGFSGNILLKNTEAVGKKAVEIIENLLGENKEILDKIKTAVFKAFDFNAQGAATFLGTKKTVLKMHGCANINTVKASIEQIIRLENASFSKEMTKALTE